MDIDDRVRRVRDNWVSALFAAGYGLLRDQQARIREAVGVGETDQDALSDQAFALVMADEEVVPGTLLARYMDVCESVEQADQERLGFDSSDVIDIADHALGEFLGEYGENASDASINPDGVTRLNWVNINHALKSVNRNISEG
jgi:hypothetical protein